MKKNIPTRETFSSEVYEIVRQIPPGRVLTYGRIAAWAGWPAHARRVGQAMGHAPSDETLPCHRVVNHAGGTAPGWTAQRELLEAEGVTFKANGKVDMKKFEWKIEI